METVTIDQFSKEVEKLKISEQASEKEKVIDNLLEILISYDGDICAKAQNEGLVMELSQLLKMKKGSRQKIAQIIAELAKTESLRQPFVDHNLIPPLVQILHSDDTSEAIQACRALGNICYENDTARNAVDNVNGVKVLLELMKGTDSRKGPDINKLRTVACGLLLNVTNTHETLQEKALEGDALGILDDYLQNYSDDEGLPYMVLLALGSLAESVAGREKIGCSTICKSVADFLQLSRGGSIQETALDLLVNMAENDEIKIQLAKTTLCDYLIKMIQSNAEDAEDVSQQKVKLSSDLIVLLLTGDKSMEMLFQKGNGPIYIEAVRWLESSSDHLQISAALAIGNFARNDEHCLQLVEEGIPEKMLSLLKQQDHKEPNISLLHAILSVLRNLAIPAPNKSKLIKTGVIDVLLSFTSTSILAVSFKMLGALRMLVDGHEEAAKQLGRDRDFLAKLVEWCGVEEHACVKGEATRLLAWIVKNSKSAEIMKNIVRADGIQYLVPMATSEHIVMQNEALVALTMIGSSILDEAAMALKEADLIDVIASLLKNQQTIPDILANTLSLTRAILQAATPSPPHLSQCSLLACTGLLTTMQGNLKEELIQTGIAETAKELSQHESSKVRHGADMLLSVLEETMLIER